MTLDSLEQIVDDWSEMLFRIIPESRLHECYLDAYRNHKPGFTMECAELLQSWYRLAAGMLPASTYAANCTLCEAHNKADRDSSIPPCPFHQQGEALSLRYDYGAPPRMPGNPIYCQTCGVDLNAKKIPPGGFGIVKCPTCCRLTLKASLVTKEMEEDAGPPDSTIQDKLTEMIEPCSVCNGSRMVQDGCFGSKPCPECGIKLGD